MGQKEDKLSEGEVKGARNYHLCTYLLTLYTTTHNINTKYITKDQKHSSFLDFHKESFNNYVLDQI